MIWFVVAGSKELTPNGYVEFLRLNRSNTPLKQKHVAVIFDDHVLYALRSVERDHGRYAF